MDLNSTNMLRAKNEAHQPQMCLHMLAQTKRIWTK